MRRTCVLLAICIVCLVSAASITTTPASNTGFKIFYRLYAGGDALPEGGTSQSGTNSLCLPYIPESGLSTASDLKDDINDQHGSPVVVSVSRFLRETDYLETYVGDPGKNFALEPGTEYRIVVSETVDYRILGSHDPGLTMNLEAAGPNSNSGTQGFCFPYHTPNANASELRDEIDAAAGTTAVTSISRFLRDSDSLRIYTGLNPDTNFDVTIGEGYRIVVSEDVSFVPDHY